MDSKEMYDRICGPRFVDVTKRQRAMKEVVDEILQKLKNGITERLDRLGERLDEQNERMNRLEGLIWKLLFAVLGLFGSLIVGLVIVLLRGIGG